MSKYNVVFDTSALLSENFPEMSASFRQLFETAESLNINLYIPEIVIRELEQKFMDKTDESINKIKNEYKKLKKIVQDKFDLSAPKLEDIRVVYAKEVQNLINSNKLRIIPMPSIKADELIDKAIKRVPPFEGADKGFRDAMIIESIIAYGVSNKIKNFVFVSFDKIFENGEIAMAAKSKGIGFHLEKRISDVNEMIFKLLGQVEQKFIKEREKRAIALLKTEEDEINEYLKTNFEITEYDISGLHGIPLRMLEVKLVNIESAVLEEKEDNKIGISFEAKVTVTMLVRSFGLGFGLPEVRRFKIGESGATEIDYKRLLDYAFKAPDVSSFMQPVEVKKTINIKVKGEIEVELVEKEYKNFRIIYIRPQSQSLLGS